MIVWIITCELLFREPTANSNSISQVTGLYINFANGPTASHTIKNLAPFLHSMASKLPEFELKLLTPARPTFPHHPSTAPSSSIASSITYFKNVTLYVRSSIGSRKMSPTDRTGLPGCSPVSEVLSICSICAPAKSCSCLVYLSTL